MAYTATDLANLQKALASGQHRVTVGSKTVEYRNVADLKAAIQTVQDALAAAAGLPRVRQVRMISSRGLS